MQSQPARRFCRARLSDWLARPAFHRVRYLSASFAPSFSFVLTCP